MRNNYISTREAAELLGYTLQHTRLLIRDGKLEAEKFGRDWLVVRESVTNYNTGTAFGDPPGEFDAPERAEATASTSNLPDSSDAPPAGGIRYGRSAKAIRRGV